jgi:hypothetical protein
MTHKEVMDASVLPELLAQIPQKRRLKWLSVMAPTTHKRFARPLPGVAPAVIPPVEGAVHWPASQPGAPERNEAIEHIARSGKQDWKDKRRYHRRSLVENLMYRFKTLTGDRLWARDVNVQDAEVAVRVGILNRMATLSPSCFTRRRTTFSEMKTCRLSSDAHNRRYAGAILENPRASQLQQKSWYSW